MNWTKTPALAETGSESFCTAEATSPLGERPLFTVMTDLPNNNWVPALNQAFNEDIADPPEGIDPADWSEDPWGRDRGGQSTRHEHDQRHHGGKIPDRYTEQPRARVTRPAQPLADQAAPHKLPLQQLVPAVRPRDRDLVTTGSRRDRQR